MEDVLSFVISSDFGFFKKPEINEVSLTYDIIPKPALLGILGAFLGKNGYSHQSSDEPEWYAELKGFQVGVEPLRQIDGERFKFEPITKPFLKTFINYINYHGHSSDRGVQILKEQVLIQPAFRIFIRKGNCKSETFKELKETFLEGTCVFSPYMGKNDFPISLFYENTSREIEVVSENTTKVDSLIFKGAVGDKIIPPKPRLDQKPLSFFSIYFQVPYKFIDGQYKLNTAIFSNRELEIKKDPIKKEGFSLLKVDGRVIFFF